MTQQEVYEVFNDHLLARTKAGFNMPATRAYEDAAYECDLSISEVVHAVATVEQMESV